MDQELQFLNNLFSAEVQTINLVAFVIQIIITTILALVISYTYVRFGNALSNRRALSRNFVLIALTTMLIITIVKSSLALSLGLVGALSIVRFRTAIKEPEELAYFFIVISIGLGIGAGQYWATLIGTIGICIIIYFLNRKKTTEVAQNLILKVNNPEDSDISNIIDLLDTNCSQLELRRLEEDAEFSEVSFVVRFKDVEALLNAKNSLKAKYPDINFSFLELL